MDGLSLIYFFLDIFSWIFLPLVVIFWATAKDLSQFAYYFVLLMVLFIIGALAHGGFYDLFNSLPWTLSIAMFTLTVVFVVLQYRSTLSTESLLILAGLFFLLIGDFMFWANLIGISLYYLFWVGFILLVGKIVFRWFTVPE